MAKQIEADIVDDDVDYDDSNDSDVALAPIKTDRNAAARRLLEIRMEERALSEALRDYYDFD